MSPEFQMVERDGTMTSPMEQGTMGGWTFLALAALWLTMAAAPVAGRAADTDAPQAHADTSGPNLAQFVLFGRVDRFEARTNMLQITTRNPYPTDPQTLTYRIGITPLTLIYTVAYARPDVIESFQISQPTHDTSLLRSGQLVRVAGVKKLDQKTGHRNLVATLVAIDQFP